MGGMKISELDFLRLLPSFMRDDETAIALSKAMNKLAGDPGKRVHTLSTWNKIDDMDENECDELAWELDVDWYDSVGMNLAEKRATLKVAQQVKRKRGTKWAVERLISAYFGEGYVMEWYDTGGDPYTCVALTTNTRITADNFVKFVEAVKAAKNERSRIVGVFYFWQQGPDTGIEYALGADFHKYSFEKCGVSPRISTKGFLLKSAVESEPETKLHKYTFEKCSEDIPQTCTALKDISTGKRYFLYVSGDKLWMAPTTANTERTRVYFSGKDGSEGYVTYVSDGRLWMAPTGLKPPFILTPPDYLQHFFIDHMDKEPFYTFVENGRLVMGY